MGKSARVEGKWYYCIPGEVDGEGNPIYHCKAPGCSYTCKNPSGVRLHWLKKHKDVEPGAAASVNAQAPGRQQKQKATAGTKDKPTGTAAVMVQAERGLKKCTVCGGEVWLLRSNDPRHAKSIAKGYTRFCTECEEVFE